MTGSFNPPLFLPIMTKMPLTTTIITTLLISVTTLITAAPTVTFTPSTLSKPGDNVTVTWSGITNPSKLDWLGIYSPPESPHHYFIGYFFLSNSTTYLSGSGSITFPLINLRTPYTFRIFHWTESEINPKKTDHDKNPLPQIKHLLAESGVLGFENVNAPQQVHLSFTDEYDEMGVMFVTGNSGSRFVRWGLKEDQLDGVVMTNVVKYGVEDMCDSPANQSVGWRDPGFIHDGVMGNLRPGVRYFYKVGSDGDWSPTYSFISRNDDSDETVAFIFGDMGTATPYRTFIRTQDESAITVKWILRDLEGLGEKPAFVSHIGDISYARGYAWIWDNFFNQIEPIASQVAYHVCIGNHEYDWPLQPWKPVWAAYGNDGGGECGVPYSLRFKMPGNSSLATNNHAPATRNLYYSMDVGVVHFVYISTETNFLKGSAQYDFLKHDLENVDRKKTPFVVVQGHRPMYTTSNELRDSALRDKMMEHLEPLLVKNNVTLALWGHVHRYERFCPLSNYTCGTMGAYGEKQGGYPVHAVIGMAGQDWQPIWEPRPEHTDMPVFPQPRRSLYRGGEFGYTRLVATREKLTLSYVGNHDGEVHDMVEILADGEAVSGGSLAAAADPVELLSDKDEVGSKFEKFFLSQYVKGATVLVLGVFAGYIMGFVSRGRRENPVPPRKNWIPLKTDES